LDALVEAIKATKKLQQINGINQNIENQVKNALGQAVYGADEYNRLSGHQAAVLAVAISPDSSIIASASADNTVKLWRRDGLHIVSAGDDHIIKIWQRYGQLLKTLTGHNTPIWAVKFSPDGKLIVSTSLDSTIKIWNTDGTLLKTFKGHSAGIFGVAFSQDSQIFASASQDKTIKLWRRDGELLPNHTYFRRKFQSSFQSTR
jgi:WD40 repeat protein